VKNYREKKMLTKPNCVDWASLILVITLLLICVDVAAQGCGSSGPCPPDLPQLEPAPPAVTTLRIIPTEIWRCDTIDTPCLGEPPTPGWILLPLQDPRLVCDEIEGDSILRCVLRIAE